MVIRSAALASVRWSAGLLSWTRTVATALAGSSARRRAMAGSAVSSPSSQCQSKPVGTTMLPRGPAMPTHWPTVALAAQSVAGPASCRATSMSSSPAAASKRAGV